MKQKGMMTNKSPGELQSKLVPPASQTTSARSPHPDLQRTQGKFGTKVILDGPHKTDWL